MLYLIERMAARVLPARLHRALLPLAFHLRDGWRRWRGVRREGCAIVITNGAGQVLLLRHSYGPRVWGLPGGGIAKGEAPEDAARREIAEELNLALPHVAKFASIDEEIAGAPHTAHLFAATCDARPEPDRREVIEARFFPPHSLPEPLGRITRGRLAEWRARMSKPAAGAPPRAG
jgi:ADP-ribose pyrophosphatase YjhB (NUDIX family)